MWTVETALTAYPACPLCGGTDRAPTRLDPLPTGVYIDPILRSRGLDPEDVVPRIVVQECAACATVWNDPWFDLDFIAGAYSYAMGRHNYGWAALRSWGARQFRPYWPSRVRLLALLRRLVPRLGCYAEVNCPFSGLLPLLPQERMPDFDRRTVSDKAKALRALYGGADDRESASATAAFATVANGLRRPSEGETKHLLILEPSPIDWGRSCILAGASCHALAQDLFVDRFTTFEQLGKTAPRPEAIGLFDIVSRALDPMGLIEKALSASDLVAIDMEAYTWIDAQHRMNVGTGLVGLLRDRGHSAVDVGALITEGGRHGDRRRYVLCTARPEMAERLRAVPAS